MAVAITFALSSGGVAATEKDFSEVSTGNYSASQQVYIRHDGSNPITGCAIYFKAKASGYSGSASAADDFSEIKDWGNQSVAADHGGVQINMDPSNTSSWDTTTWDLSESTKQTSYAFTMHSGTGDLESNAVSLKETMDGTASGGTMTTDGVIPSGVEVSCLVRFQVPTNESTTGTRQLDMVLKYTYTS